MRWRTSGAYTYRLSLGRDDSKTHAPTAGFPFPASRSENFANMLQLVVIFPSFPWFLQFSLIFPHFLRNLHVLSLDLVSLLQYSYYRMFLFYLIFSRVSPFFNYISFFSRIIYNFSHSFQYSLIFSCFLRCFSSLLRFSPLRPVWVFCSFLLCRWYHRFSLNRKSLVYPKVYLLIPIIYYFLLFIPLFCQFSLILPSFPIKFRVFHIHTYNELVSYQFISESNY